MKCNKTMGWITNILCILSMTCVFYILLSHSSQDINDKQTFNSYFDISALENWCSEPVGTIRMLGARMDENGLIEDETGNLWDWGGPIPNCKSCLVWIDDMNTPDFVEDDEIVKLWIEFDDWG